MTGVAAPKVKKDKIVSCAECRRLKLKCDRNFPCSSCRKRGLDALCPNMALPTRPRKQPLEDAKGGVSSSGMVARVRELEDALRSLHALHSDDPHPLLADRGHATSHAPLAVPSGSKSARPDSPVEGELDRLDETLGTLSIDPQSGKSSFFGQSAGMESLYHNELREDVEDSEVQLGWSSDPFDPLRDDVASPLYPRLPNEVIMQHLERHLPDPLRAWALCDFYHSNAAWLYSPISRHQFQDEILLPVYSKSPPSLTDTSLTHFEVSILFMVFAIGSLLDLSDPADAGNNYDYNSNAVPQTGTDSDLYHQFARTALTAGVSVIEEPGIAGVRVIFLMAYYHSLLDREQTPQLIWSLTSMAVGLAISIGLHRDSEGWRLDPSVVDQRRSLFWELSAFLSFQVRAFHTSVYPSSILITFQGLAFGRPPQITLPFVDCKIGPDTEQSIGPDGKIKHGHRYSMYMITFTIMSEVRDLVLSTKQKYADILAMDRKLRDRAVELFGGPVGDRQVGPDCLKGANTAETMRKFFMLAIKETYVLYLHRKYFVRACLCRPEDLTTSRYYPSLLAAFRSAQVIISLLDCLLTHEPVLPCRLWFCWTHTLASAIMVGSVAMRHPRSVLAAEAMCTLETVLVQLRGCANQNNRIVDRPRRALKIVTRLREKAHLAMSQLEYSTADGDIQGQDDELKVLGGHTRVVSIRPGTYLATAQSSPSMDTPPSTDVHPSLMEDLTVVRQQDQDAWRAWERTGGVANTTTATTATMSAETGAGAGGPEISSRQSTRIEVFPGEVSGAPQSSYSTASHGSVSVTPFGEARGMEDSHVRALGVDVGVRGDAASHSDAAAYAMFQAPHDGGDGGSSAVYGHGVTAVHGYGNAFALSNGGVGASVGTEANDTDSPMQDPRTWNPMSSMMMTDDYLDVSWQGFVAELGVSGG